MPDAPAITLGPRSLRLGDEDLPLVSGAMHYFRVAPRHWGACLRAVKALGLSAVETYVPWGVHETAPGRFRWSGDLDLGAFLDAAAAEGLRVLVRPGPHINAELTWFGFPERIVTDEAMQARSARGTPVVLPAPPRFFPVPSYWSAKFHTAVRDWFAAVAEVVKPRLWPAGPVVALQVDNEQGHFFRAGGFDGDYHADALAAWHAEGHTAPPPRRLDARTPAELAPVLAWLAFKERGIARALAALGKILDDVGLVGVPRYHNFPPLEPGIYDVAAAEETLDFAGIDLYHGRRQYERIRRRALYLAGTSRLPYAPELAAGSFPWGPPFSVEDTRTLYLGALMHGVAGANLYMAVERDRWYGSPISSTGERRPGLADDLTKVHAALQQAHWTQLSRRADVGVLIPREYQRLALATSLLGAVGPFGAEALGWDEQHTVRRDTFGLAGPVQEEQVAWRDAITNALSRAHVPFVFVDSSAAQARLAERKLLIVPTFDFLDEDLAKRLREYVAQGGKLASGPRAPRLDAAMQQKDVSLPGDALDAALLDDPRQLQARLVALAEAASAIVRVAAAKEPTVDTALHVAADGAPVLLFVATRQAEPLTAAIELGAAATVEDVLTGERFTGETLAIPLAPFQVRMLRYA